MAREEDLLALARTRDDRRAPAMPARRRRERPTAPLKATIAAMFGPVLTDTARVDVIRAQSRECTVGGKGLSPEPSLSGLGARRG
jgi:hypothetical protein